MPIITRLGISSAFTQCPHIDFKVESTKDKVSAGFYPYRIDSPDQALRATLASVESFLLLRKAGQKNLTSPKASSESLQTIYSTWNKHSSLTKQKGKSKAHRLKLHPLYGPIHKKHDLNTEGIQAQQGLFTAKQALCALAVKRKDHIPFYDSVKEQENDNQWIYEARELTCHLFSKLYTDFALAEPVYVNQSIQDTLLSPLDWLPPAQSSNSPITLRSLDFELDGPFEFIGRTQSRSEESSFLSVGRKKIQNLRTTIEESIEASAKDHHAAIKDAENLSMLASVFISCIQLVGGFIFGAAAPLMLFILKIIPSSVDFGTKVRTAQLEQKLFVRKNILEILENLEICLGGEELSMSSIDKFANTVNNKVNESVTTLFNQAGTHLTNTIHDSSRELNEKQDQLQKQLAKAQEQLVAQGTLLKQLADTRTSSFCTAVLEKRIAELEQQLAEKDKVIAHLATAMNNINKSV